MNQNENMGAMEKFSLFIRESATVKLIVIGIIILLLLIPLTFIHQLVRERQNRQYEAVADVGKSWGYRQTLTGPVISIPFNSSTGTSNSIETVNGYAHFLPELLDIHSDIKTEVRKRGIFEVVVYTTEVTMRGKFSRPDLSIIPANAGIETDKAVVCLGISDLHNLNDLLALNWNGEKLNMEPGNPEASIMGTGVCSQIKIDPLSEDKYEFEIKLNLRGSEGLSFTPVGKETKVTMSGDWASPAFQGAFLPEHRISGDKFDATWKVTYMNRDYPQQFIGAVPGIVESQFGMDLYVPVTDYQKNERAAKYAVLIIALTFMIFFFVQILNKVRIHGIQFLLVGFALCLFYVLLLSFTEHTGFNAAYLIAAMMTISLVAFYIKAIYKNKKLTWLNFLFLILVYGFVFVIIQLEEFALLVGSLGLFAVLASAMYLSRNITWSENLSGRQ